MPVFRRWFLTVFLCALAMPAPAGDGPAADLFRKGVRAQRQGRDIEAYLLYSQARALAPANAKYAHAASRVRRSAARLLALTGQHRAAMEMIPDSWEYPRDQDKTGPASSEDTVAVARPLPQITQPARLRYSGHEASFRFRGTVREAYEAVAEEFGVRVLFHEDFEGERTLRGGLDEADFPSVMRILAQVGRTLTVPLDSQTLLVADDDPSIRGGLEAAALAHIPLDRSLPQEGVAEVTQVIRDVLDIKRTLPLVSADALVLRGPVQKLDMARILAGDLLRPSAAVQIEIQMLTVSRGRNVRGGIDLPGTFPVANFSTLFGAVPSNGGVERLIGLGGGETVLGIAVGTAAVEAGLNSSSAQSIHTVQLRSAHGVEATFKAGESFPIATSQFSAGSLDLPGVGTPGYVQPPPTVTFQDLGLSLNVTPLIHTAGEVTLALDVAFKFLAGGSVNGVPVLANREFQSQVRLRSNEFAIVSGTSVFERRVSAAGQAGLGNIPIIGSLFRRNERRWDERDLLILVRPRVVNLPAAELARMPAFLFGSEERAVPAL